MKFAIALCTLLTTGAQAIACSDGEIASLLREANRLDVIALNKQNANEVTPESVFAERRAAAAQLRLYKCLLSGPQQSPKG